jgi:hypothetical protein
MIVFGFCSRFRFNHSHPIQKEAVMKARFSEYAGATFMWTHQSPAGCEAKGWLVDGILYLPADHPHLSKSCLLKAVSRREEVKGYE